MEIKTILLLSFSAIVTILIWARIVRSGGKMWFKLFNFLLATIPVFGPIFYILINPPPTLPRDRCEGPFPKGTKVYPSFQPLIDTFANLFKSK